MRPATPEAYQLMHDGALALATAEANGIRVDTEYLDGAIIMVSDQIKTLTEDLKTTDVGRTWRKRYGSESNFGSRDQLASVLFEDMGFTCKHLTASKKPLMDEYALQQLDIPFVKDYLKIEKLKKLCGTYLKGVRSEVADGFLHPFFNLHLVITFRSSSDSPNFQNLPIRDKAIGKWIRSAFIPRDGHVLVELDFVAAEVRIAACYHKDPTMLQYIEDNHDLHSDMAAECYLLPHGKIPKPVRGTAKGGFVFAEFYGDFYASVCQNLWNAIETDGLKTAEGLCLIEHLASKGITKLGKCDFKQAPSPGTFEHHIKEVEDRFWKERFPIYDEWRRWWYKKYLEFGYYRMKTGFVSQGVFKRNEVINSPVQGSAFHCLLWSFIQLNKWLTKNKMKSKLVGQIHDSIIADVHESELQDYLTTAKRIMTQDLRKIWPWIITPMEIEAEASETNWFEKKPVPIAA